MRKSVVVNLLIGSVAGIVAAGGCSHPRGAPEIGHEDTDLNVIAIKKAVRAKDLSHAEKLVSNLASDDAAVRFYAIRGLADLTGETFGYVYYAGEDDRRPALKKWQAWLTGRGGTTRPADDAMTHSGGAGR